MRLWCGPSCAEWFGLEKWPGSDQVADRVRAIHSMNERRAEKGMAAVERAAEGGDRNGNGGDRRRWAMMGGGRMVDNGGRRWCWCGGSEWRWTTVDNGQMMPDGRWLGCWFEASADESGWMMGGADDSGWTFGGGG